MTFKNLKSSIFLFSIFVWSPALWAQSDVAFPPEVYAARRSRLAQLAGGAPIIVPGEYLVRSGGAGRQDLDFWYLTGVESPYAVLVMVPGDNGGREALFLPERFQFAGAQYPIDDPRFREAAWNQPIRRLSPGDEAEDVNEALDRALATIKPGVMMLDVVKAAAGVFHEYDLEAFEDIERMGADKVWGIMPSPTAYIVQGDALSTDYSGAGGTGVRDLGHHIGLDALDSRDYSLPLAPGMVFTVEPKLYIPEKGIAIMIEEMVLVTEDGCENLSRSTPRSADEIERAMGNR